MRKIRLIEEEIANECSKGYVGCTNYLNEINKVLDDFQNGKISRAILKMN